MDVVTTLQNSPSLWILLAALLAACVFEFINGFHDTANAVATVIYTKSLKPWIAVALSGFFNFLGVFIGGTAVAMAIVKLLPMELLVTHDLNVSMIMVFSLLSTAIIWNFGTWYLGLPASSSHTLIGAILGVGVAHAFVTGANLSETVSWSKAIDIGLSLLISPMVGFAIAAALLLLSKKIWTNPVLHTPPRAGKTPPLGVRAILIATSSGVSLAHGSNDGQKGVGLIMLILIAIMPAHFSLQPNLKSADLLEARHAAMRIEALASGHSIDGSTLASLEQGGSTWQNTAWAGETPRGQMNRHSRRRPNAPEFAPTFAPEDVSKFLQISSIAHTIANRLSGVDSVAGLKPEDRYELRSDLLNLDHRLGKLEKGTAGLSSLSLLKAIKSERAPLKKLVEYAPTWVILLVALSLGIGTLVGWKRIAVTVGEKIGKGQLTYAKGAVVQLVAMSTIGLSAILGLPVSTTHILSSGVAGTMVAGRAGVQPQMIQKILLAWVLTLPASIGLSAGFYCLLTFLLK